MRDWLHNGRYGFDYMIRIKPNYKVTLSVLSEPAVRYEAKGYVDIKWNSSTEGTMYFYNMKENLLEKDSSKSEDKKTEIEPFELNVTIENGVFEYIDFNYKDYSTTRYKLSANPIRMCYSNENREDEESVYFFDREQQWNGEGEITHTLTNYNSERDLSQSVREVRKGEWLANYIWKINKK